MGIPKATAAGYKGRMPRGTPDTMIEGMSVELKKKVVSGGIIGWMFGGISWGIFQGALGRNRLEIHGEIIGGIFNEFLA